MSTTTWYAFLRVEKNGDYAEHDGTIDIEPRRGAPAPTARDVEHAVAALLMANSPQLRGGRITRRTIRRVR